MTSAKTPGLATMQAVLSQPRMMTYERAACSNPDRAVRLYEWNAKMAAALMFPMHFAEVSTRNAVSEGIEAVYGSSWPWNQTFERSLPVAPRGFNARQELVDVRRRQPTTGKVVAELKFVFWQKMFTGRFDGRLWNHQILGLFPHSSVTDAAQLRSRIYSDLEVIRLLRNRMAHHEPIFSRNLNDELTQILDLVELRSVTLSAWVRATEGATALLPTKP
ncbi:hypothetical protein [Arthrobacter sp. NA-172]|uniref:hypothetical protein n=1 Tax=Arthrobacter sp. NA-172 TaxID=3367524 RepID=UPI003754AC77